MRRRQSGSSRSVAAVPVSAGTMPTVSSFLSGPVKNILPQNAASNDSDPLIAEAILIR